MARERGAARRGASGRRGGLLVAAAALLGGTLLTSGAARAGDFEDGFEDQLGRIAAVQVFRVGQVLLQGVVDPYAVRRAPHGHHPRYGAPPAYGHRPYYPPVSYRRPVYRRHAHPHATAYPHAHPHPVAYPTTTVVVQGAPQQAPCSQHPQAAPAPSPAPYGERIVYERYERTVLPPPETVVVPESRRPAAATRLSY